MCRHAMNRQLMHMPHLPFPPRPLTHFIAHSLLWPPIYLQSASLLRFPFLPVFLPPFALKPAIQPPTFHTSTTATAISKELVATTTATMCLQWLRLYFKRGFRTQEGILQSPLATLHYHTIPFGIWNCINLRKRIPCYLKIL